MRVFRQQAAHRREKQVTCLRWKSSARTFWIRLRSSITTCYRRTAPIWALHIEQAQAHSRLGDIDRLMEKHPEAASEYGKAISSFSDLSNQYPTRNELRQALAYAHNWLGETIRDALNGNSKFGSYGPSDAEKEYSEAIRLQQDLHTQEPSNAIYQQELARSYYNRGIIRFQQNNCAGCAVRLSQCDRVTGAAGIDAPARCE